MNVFVSYGKRISKGIVKYGYCLISRGSFFLEVLGVNIIVIFHGRVDVPDSTISRKIGVIDVGAFWWGSGDLSASVVSEGIVFEEGVVVDVVLAGGGGVRSAWVEELSRVHVGSDSVFEHFEGLLELG
jgi:hypothetical protein